MVTIQFDGSSLHVFNTHLDYRPDPTVRHKQVAEMLDRLAPFETPMILMGDLNAPPGSDELEPLDDVFVDAWEKAGSDEGYTYPSGDSVKRIDFVFVTPDVAVA